VAAQKVLPLHAAKRGSQKPRKRVFFHGEGVFFPEGGQHVKNTRALSSRLAAVVVVTRLSVAGLPIRLLACLHTHGLSIA